MKTKEELKQEQYDLKARLHEVIELINSEEYYSLHDEEKALINQQRTGMELYLSCLTKRIYGDSGSVDTRNLLWMTMLYGMFNSSGGFGSNTGYLKDALKESDFEDSKEESHED